MYIGCTLNLKELYTVQWILRQLSGLSVWVFRILKVRYVLSICYKCTNLKSVTWLVIARVRVTCHRSGFGPQQPIGSLPDPSKNLTCSDLVGQIQTCTHQLAGFARVGLTHRFHSPVLRSGFHNFSSHSDMLLQIAKYSLWYVNVCFGCIGLFSDQNKQRFTPFPILTMGVDWVSMIVDLTSLLITAWNGYYCLYTLFSLFFHAKMLINT